MCRVCQREHQSVVVVRHVDAFPLIWQAIIPVMGTIFLLVMLGLHLG
jgi:hypothetical protein